MTRLRSQTSSVDRPRHPRTVLFDGGCRLCSGVVSALRRLDVLNRIEYLDVTRDWDIIGRRYPHLSQEACLTDMHVIDDRGRVSRGFEGYRALAWVVPLAWLTLPLLYLPGVPAIGRRVYRYVADHRSRAACPAPRRDLTRATASLRARPPRQ